MEIGWRLITAWCPRCWWKVQSDFHPDTTRAAIQKHFDRWHRNEAPKCDRRAGAYVRLEGAPAPSGAMIRDNLTQAAPDE